MGVADWWARGIGLAGLVLSIIKIATDTWKAQRRIRIIFEEGVGPPRHMAFGLLIRLTNDGWRPVKITGLTFGNPGGLGISEVFRNLPEGSVRVYTEEHEGELLPSWLQDGETVIAFVPDELVRTFADKRKVLQIEVNDNRGKAYRRTVPRKLRKKYAS